MRPASILK